MEWFGLVLFLYSASGHLSLVSSASNSLYGKYSSYNVGYRESEIVSLLPVSLRPYFTRLSNPMRLYEATRLRGFFFSSFFLPSHSVALLLNLFFFLFQFLFLHSIAGSISFFFVAFVFCVSLSLIFLFFLPAAISRFNSICLSLFSFSGFGKQRRIR
jgi:hypothetical protein